MNKNAIYLYIYTLIRRKTYRNFETNIKTYFAKQPLYIYLYVTFVILNIYSVCILKFKHIIVKIKMYNSHL